MPEPLRCLVSDAEERMEIIRRLLDQVLGPVPDDAPLAEQEYYRLSRIKAVRDNRWIEMEMSELRELEARYARLYGGRAQA